MWIDTINFEFWIVSVPIKNFVKFWLNISFGSLITPIQEYLLKTSKMKQSQGSARGAVMKKECINSIVSNS